MMIVIVMGAYALVTLFGAGVAASTLFNRAILMNCDCESCMAEQENRTWSNAELMAAFVVATAIGVIDGVIVLDAYMRSVAP